jgi:hypothetical protein
MESTHKVGSVRTENAEAHQGSDRKSPSLSSHMLRRKNDTYPNTYVQLLYAPYSPIDGHAVAQLPYYRQLFFHLATAHAALLPSLLNSAENVATYVLKGTDGTLRVAVINKEPKQGIAITMQPGGRYQKMTILRMQAASLTSTSSATIGGASIGSDGTWITPALTSALVSGEQAILGPAGSAALFTFSF